MRALVIGGLESSLVESLLSQGHDVVLCHELAHAAKVERRLRVDVPRLLIRSGRSPESVLGALMHHGWDQKADCVVPGGELEVVTCAVVGALLGARAMPVPTAVACRDKSVQKQRWRAAGVPIADWAVFANRALDADAVLREVGIELPCVVKPLDDGGTTGVALVHTVEELMVQWAGLGAPMLAEQFIDLPEWHFDGVVQSTEITHLMVSRYRNPLLATKSGVPVQSITYPASTNSELYETARAFTARSAAALGLTDGVFHFEAFGDGAEFIAGELACRPGGGMIPQVGRTVLGVDLWDVSARLLTGDEIPSCVTVADDYIGFVNLPSVVNEVNTVDVNVFTEMPGVLGVMERSLVGEVMGDMAQAVGFGMGYVMAGAPTSDDLATLLDKIVGYVQKAQQNGTGVIL